MSTPDPRWVRIDELFRTAADLPSGEQLPFLQSHCGDDPSLVGEVLSLLEQSEGAGRETLLSSMRRAVRTEQTVTEPPSQIGPYRILETIGEGGMGTVYRAEQHEPVKRQVALKLIKLGMDSKAFVARFEQERQALALMQHDGIAKVHDCGTSERGQPYFVMEFVSGQPLAHYCDARRLSLPARLRLLQQVCAAVTHAHQKGIVHRDLKPGNVLVTEQDGKPQVKIIDFGLAKAMDDKLVASSLRTAAGMMVGTPEYMAPEQADPTNADIDTRADVYSLGVMLHELLVGELPFTRAQVLQAAQGKWQHLEPPRPSTRLSSIGPASTQVALVRRMSTKALQRALKTDLDWVVLKAMEPDRTRRYETANALAMDLQRYLDHEPLVAGPPSPGYRLKKLMRRYRGQVVAAAAVFITAIAGTVVAVKYAFVAENSAVEAQSAQGRADDKLREFDQLAGMVLYERAIANEKKLHPAWPSMIEAMETWLREDAGKLLAMKDGIEQTVRDLEGRARPPTPEEQEADERSHPRFAEFELLGRRVTSLRYAQTIREGKALVVPDLTGAQQVLDAGALNSLARPRVAPPAKADIAEERTIYGEEAFGLACARAAVAKAYATDGEYQLLDTLAWALLANGQDAEAKAKSAEALGNAPDNVHEVYLGYQQDLDAAVTNAAEILATAEQQLADLGKAVNKRRTFRFELDAQRFLHDTLAELFGKLGSLEAKEKAEVDRRLTWAKQIQGLSLAHPNAKHTWAAVRTAIASNAKYAGQKIELRDEDITGLVPIGENPVTRMWEFYELRSAWDGKADPREIAIPTHRADGSIEVTGDTGIVFALLPGGTFTMGAQKDDENKPNFDPQAQRDETPHEVTLAPFFLARHELTQGQWARLWIGDESLRWPSAYNIGGSYQGIPVPIGPSHPVENVDWAMCDTLLRRSGMSLPTEAQWEFGCRAGQPTPWYTGELPTSLAGHGNVLDRDAVKDYPAWGIADAFQDGFAGPGPVGHYRGSNGFGLYDVHGNVREWCRDWYGSYAAPWKEGDGLRLVGPSFVNRVVRGGGFAVPAAIARSAFRSGNAPSVRSFVMGLRPARTFTP